MIAPRELGPNDLVMSHFTLARDHPIGDRIEAAARAGFAGIGLYAGHFAQMHSDGLTIEQLRDSLVESDICLAEIEVLSGWGAAAPGSNYQSFEDTVWQLVDAFEARYVQAIGPYDGSIADAAARFAALCDRAADHGAVVGLEFLPFTNIVDASDALAIVEQAGRANGGVCIDIWHHARGADDLELIRAIPPELIVGIQMSDGTRTPTLADYKDDCLRHRLPPGAGEFGAVEFVRTLIDLGADVPWSLEVCNEAVWSKRGGDHALSAAEGMRRVLSEARAANRPAGPHSAGPHSADPHSAGPHREEST